MYAVRITVVKRMANRDLIEEYAGDLVRAERLAEPFCKAFSDGQEFVLTDASTMPDGFCPWAWSDLHKEILAISAGGDLRPWLRAAGVAIACCTDAFRPVAFRIERGEPIPREAESTSTPDGEGPRTLPEIVPR